MTISLIEQIFCSVVEGVTSGCSAHYAGNPKIDDENFAIRARGGIEAVMDNLLGKEWKKHIKLKE